ncbi:PDZ domain-containing protein [Candidatus Palauibacter sp.]|uniref:PDZ domain-containing protein n=1 Tax=Candidatus Palauibacter sp. TaxID=3101350 RepID=UPI003B5D013D
MKRDSRKSLAVGLGMALFAGLWAVVGPAAAQEEEEDEERERVSIAFTGGGGYLGVEIADVDEERASEAGMPRPYGVYIRGVVEDGPASDAGIEEGDVILRWNGGRVESVAQLQRLVTETPPGRIADITVLRDGVERELSVELDDRTDQLGLAMGNGMTWLSAPRVEMTRERTRAARERALEAQERARERVREVQERARSGVLRSVWLAGRPRLGVSMQSLGDQLAEYFGVEDGALVTSVTEDSPAAAGGLLAGDVIVGIGDEDVDGPGELREALSDLEAGAVSVRIVRDGEARTLTVELAERERPLLWRRGADGVDMESFEFDPVEWDFDFEFPEGIQSFEIPRIQVLPAHRVAMRV